MQRPFLLRTIVLSTMFLEHHLHYDNEYHKTYHSEFQLYCISFKEIMHSNILSNLGRGVVP